MGYMRVNPANRASIPPSVVNAARRDQTYFREISSPDVRRMFEAVEEVLDPMEYEGSLLFDEYPDAGKIARLTDLVLGRARRSYAGIETAEAGNGETDAKNRIVEAGSAEADAKNRTAEAWSAETGEKNRTVEARSAETDAKNRDDETGSRNADMRKENPALERKLAKALLCEEMCRRRFRHLMRRVEISDQKQ